MGRESLQKLWQKYKVDIAVYGYVHSYERTCPIFQEKHHYHLAWLSVHHRVLSTWNYFGCWECRGSLDVVYITMLGSLHDK
ncbi:hypothetical protein Pyn_27004 [Prunus yedoensis var. nudiflora]|uniref:Uncharacterized protein n=1 Tax=Prunus yedoensis var. nudiflora TaxID=2094558 RepID=A0A314XGB0_PRUYE|nr:hypothetical protein Pyn_26995 [Prunus yedoensis var. nudiflora]PQP92693.1 hypothetical protein Pyn_27004 [Prunus yedoensis var. nudiflora]